MKILIPVDGSASGDAMLNGLGRLFKRDETPPIDKLLHGSVAGGVLSKAHVPVLMFKNK